ncbi:MAG: hypothetical protein QXF52_05795 [Thermoproteota archaeon]
MSQDYTMIRKEFQHLVLEGSSYEVGWQQGEVLKRQSPEAAKWFSSAEVNASKLGFSSLGSSVFLRGELPRHYRGDTGFS